MLLNETIEVHQDQIDLLGPLTVEEGVHLLLADHEVCLGASEKRAIMSGAKVVGYIRIVDASGPLEVGVRLTGTPSRPRYAGRIAVRDGTFRNGRDGARYRAIAGSIEFDNDRISIPELRAASTGGEARLAHDLDCAGPG